MSNTKECLPTFKNKKEALLWVANNRWSGKPQCYKCKTQNLSILEHKTKYVCLNKKCDVKSFNALSGTKLKGTQIPIESWIIACQEYNKGAKGLSCRKLAKKLNIVYPSAVRMYKILIELSKSNINLFGKYNPINQYRDIKYKHRSESGKYKKSNDTQYDGTKKTTDKQQPKTYNCETWGRRKQKGFAYKRTLSTLEFYEKFNTEAKAIDYFLQLRWNGNITCPSCEQSNISHSSSRYGHFRCKNKACKQERFNIFTNTPFQGTKLRPRQVLEILNEYVMARPSISAVELMQKTGITYRTSFYASQRARLMMLREPNKDMKGPIELDEAFPLGRKIASRTKKEHELFSIPYPVLYGAYSQQDGTSIVAMKWKAPNGDDVREFYNSIQTGNKHAFVDSASYYSSLAKDGCVLEKVNHSKKIFGKKSKWFENHPNKYRVTVNHVEHIWRELETAIIGTYRHISSKFLLLYANEISFRLHSCKTTMDISHRIENVFKNGIGKYMPQWEYRGYFCPNKYIT